MKSSKTYFSETDLNRNALRGFVSSARKLNLESKSAHLAQPTALVSSARKLA